MQQRIASRRPRAANPSAENPTGLAASLTDLLQMVDADFALLSVDEEARAIGRLDSYSEALAIMTYLQSAQFTEIRSSQNINADFPGINLPSGIRTIAGLLFIPLRAGGVNDFLVFFRKSQIRHVKWAGYVDTMLGL
jgi:light-regulated signal transduction histidine kinase (bacteriophytochrome)